MNDEPTDKEQEAVFMLVLDIIKYIDQLSKDNGIKIAALCIATSLLSRGMSIVNLEQFKNFKIAREKGEI